MPIEVLYASAGPVQTTPITFQSPVVGPVAFYLSGSGWIGSAPGSVSFNLLIDNVEAPVNYAVFTDQANSHRTVIGTFYVQTFDDTGKHTVTIATTAQSDPNDYFTLSMVY